MSKMHICELSRMLGHKLCIYNIIDTIRIIHAHTYVIHQLIKRYLSN